jgi:farnesyl-diphosphate farnesyltransferase
MREVLAAADPSGRFRLETLRELRAYCYVVAGIVGELLTTIFVHDAPELRALESTLRHYQAAFGEGLQLVNVLKDEQVDRIEGRVYLPADVSRRQVFALAREDLRHARRYIQALERGAAPAGFIAFTTLPVRLASVALKYLQRHGAGAKVPRARVQQILHSVQRSTNSVHSASAQSGK